MVYSNNRPTRDQVYLNIAEVLAFRSTCARRKVGCVLTDKKGIILATGYNGVPAGATHCIDQPCPGVGGKTGTMLQDCYAIHAEQNALMQCSNIRKIRFVYLTTSPCMHCIKMLMNTGARDIVFQEHYGDDMVQRRIWLNSHVDRQWIHGG